MSTVWPGVYGGSKRSAGTRETEVRLDGWCEGGLGQQRNDCGGCATMRKISERVESPGTYVTDAVGKSWKKGTSCNENQGADVKYMG